MNVYLIHSGADAQSKNQLLVLRVLVNIFSLGEVWIQAHQEQVRVLCNHN